MEIGWQKRPNLYDLLRPKAQSIVPAGLKCEVPERILCDGSVKTPLDEQAAIRVIRYLKKQKVQAIAVCTLFSYLNPVHENRLKELIREHVALTGSQKGKRILDHFKEYLPKFKKIIPHDYERVLRTIVQMEEKGLSAEQAQIEAFYKKDKEEA